MDRYLYEAMQDEAELAAFCELVQAEGVRSFLEVGAKFGGTTWRVGAMLPPGSRIVTVDLPGGTKAWRESEPSLKACHAALRARGVEAIDLWGNSQDPAVIDYARRHGPYDLILIDGDHRLPGVTRDWEVYREMGRMIAFHDVAWFRSLDWEGVRIDVPLLWNHLRPQFERTAEFRFDDSRKNNGIGVLWRS